MASVENRTDHDLIEKKKTRKGGGGETETEREIAAVPSIFKALLMKGYYFSQLNGSREGERLDFNRSHLCMHRGE